MGGANAFCAHLQSDHSGTSHKAWPRPEDLGKCKSDNTSAGLHTSSKKHIAINWSTRQLQKSVRTPPSSPDSSWNAPLHQLLYSPAHTTPLHQLLYSSTHQSILRAACARAVLATALRRTTSASVFGLFLGLGPSGAAAAAGSSAAGGTQAEAGSSAAGGSQPSLPMASFTFCSKGISSSESGGRARSCSGET